MKLPASLLIPDPDEVRDRGGCSTKIGAVEQVELENALAAGERSRADIAAEFDMSVRTAERLAERMRREGKRVSNMKHDDIDLHGFCAKGRRA